jgi:cytochrome b6-f complex iron-sulfur subunit
MERKEFLALIGAGSAAILCGQCFSGCKPADDITGPTNVDFTVDLNAAANASLRTNGGYIYSNGIIVARTITGTYVAVSQACTHAGATVFYNAGSNLFHCSSHGSDFATNGTVVTGPASSALTRYNTTLTGSMLRIYS